MSKLVNIKGIINANRNLATKYHCRRILSSDNHRLQLACSYYSNRSGSDIILPRAVNLPAFRPSVSISHLGTRNFHFNPTWRGQEASSKIEETVKILKEDKEEKEKMSVATADVQAAEKAVVKKRTIWQKVKAEMLHYYHGFRLLGLDMKIAAKLCWRMIKGNELTRRERRLLVKTTGDMFRLIPFSVFIIVPFMEFLLPVFIKLFPGMLPSTFQTSSDKEDKLKQALKVKIEMAKFLQQTLDDMAVQSSDHRSEKAKEFSQFFSKIRSSGTGASNDDIMKFSKLFEDEITLDSLTRPQLVALCRVLDVQTLGTTNFLRFLLRMRLRNLVADDRLIEKEGIDTLTRSELQQACRARGMRAYGMPENKLREQLNQWLDLSIHQKVPPSLLLLSRALMMPDTMAMTDQLKATISALPDDVLARTKGAIGEKEGKVDNKTNIEIIKMEERKIEEERKEKHEELKPEPIVSVHSDKKDEITTTDVKVLEEALDAIVKDKKMVVEKEELKELKEEMAEYQEDIQELNEIKAEAIKVGTPEVDLKVSKGAVRLFNKVNKMIAKMDTVLADLEKSEEQVKKKIETLKPEEKKDSPVVEELIRVDELIAAIKKIKNVPDESRLTHISEFLGKIDDDRDGAIKIEDVLKVVELIGEEDVQLSKKQLNEIIDLMVKEEVLEVEDQIQKALEKELKEASKAKEDEPVTILSDKESKEELVDSPDITVKSSDKEELNDKAPIIKEVEKLSSTVPPPTEIPSKAKAEGSKQL